MNHVNTEGDSHHSNRTVAAAEDFEIFESLFMSSSAAHVGVAIPPSSFPEAPLHSFPGSGGGGGAHLRRSGGGNLTTWFIVGATLIIVGLLTVVGFFVVSMHLSNDRAIGDLKVQIAEARARVDDSAERITHRSERLNAAIEAALGAEKQFNALDVAIQDLKLQLQGQKGQLQEIDAELNGQTKARVKEHDVLAKEVAALGTAVSRVREAMKKMESDRKDSVIHLRGGGIVASDRVTAPPNPVFPELHGDPYQQQAEANTHADVITSDAQVRHRDAPPIKQEFRNVADPVERNRLRASSVKAEFQWAWDSYKRHAWGHDELRPNSLAYRDWVSKTKGVGLTIFDSLSTLSIMGLDSDLHAAIDFVTKDLDLDQDLRISTFEATIRLVGSCLSVYELTGETNAKLLNTARRLADRLLFAFNTSSGIPHQQVNLKSHHHWNADWTNGASVLAEIGSMQLELRTLSYHTGDPVYDLKATHISAILEAKCDEDAMCVTYFDPDDGSPRDDRVSLGALGDSYYEYVLKQYLLTGKTEPKYRTRALKLLDGVERRLLRYSHPSRQAYLGEFAEGQLEHKMDHLTCFAGGMYALAAITMPEESPMAHKRIAEELTKTCVSFYRSQNSGLAPESVEFKGGGDFGNGPGYYLLRPETVESLFYVYRLTRNESYRDAAWEIFSAIKQYCRVSSGGYAGVREVSAFEPEQDDLQQSYFLAETLKYLYLTFTSDVGSDGGDGAASAAKGGGSPRSASSTTELNLEQWVLNTEAHPLRIRSRDPKKVWSDWRKGHAGKWPWRPPTIDGVEDITATKGEPGSDERRVAQPDGFAIPEPDVPEDEPPPLPPPDDAIEQQRQQHIEAQLLEAQQHAQEQPSEPPPAPETVVVPTSAEDPPLTSAAGGISTPSQEAITPSAALTVAETASATPLESKAATSPTDIATAAADATMPSTTTTTASTSSPPGPTASSGGRDAAATPAQSAAGQPADDAAAPQTTVAATTVAGPSAAGSSLGHDD